MYADVILTKSMMRGNNQSSKNENSSLKSHKEGEKIEVNSTFSTITEISSILKSNLINSSTISSAIASSAEQINDTHTKIGDNVKVLSSTPIELEAMNKVHMKAPYNDYNKRNNAKAYSKTEDSRKIKHYLSQMYDLDTFDELKRMASRIPYRDVVEILNYRAVEAPEFASHIDLAGVLADSVMIDKMEIRKRDRKSLTNINDSQFVEEKKQRGSKERSREEKKNKYRYDSLAFEKDLADGFAQKILTLGTKYYNFVNAYIQELLRYLRISADGRIENERDKESIPTHFRMIAGIISSCFKSLTALSAVAIDIFMKVGEWACSDWPALKAPQVLFMACFFTIIKKGGLQSFALSILYIKLISSTIGTSLSKTKRKGKPGHYDGDPIEDDDNCQFKIV